MNAEQIIEQLARLAGSGFPRPGLRVIAVRMSGQEVVARLDFAPDALLRPAENLHWLSDDNKFLSLGADPIVSWRPIGTASTFRHRLTGEQFEKIESALREA